MRGDLILGAAIFMVVFGAIMWLYIKLAPLP